MLFAGLVYRSRPADEVDPPTRSTKGLSAVRERLDRFRASERRAEIVDPVGRIDGLIFGVAQA